MLRTVVKNAVLGLVAASILAAMTTMALQSRLAPAPDGHPDEIDHVNAGKYFITYWDFPAIDDPRAAGTFSQYGVSYLQQLDIVYFIAGKFARLILPLAGQDYLALRFFGIAMFALLLLLTFRLPDEKKIAFLPLVLSPQVWYIFSYFNGDAFPFFLSFLLVFLAAKLPASEPLARLSWRDPGARRLAALGLVLGLLIISKQNYYVLAAFFLCFLALCGLEAGSLKTAAKNLAVVLAVALLVFGARYGHNAYVNRQAKKDAQAHFAETYAKQEYKPSAQETGKQFWGMRMREQGLTYPELFSKWTWHIWTFRTSFGVYGYMKTYAPFIYYRYMGYLVWSLIAVLAVSISVWGGKWGRLSVLLFLVFMALTIFQSTWHSWVNDFQAQGRYLFPIAGMAGLVLARFAPATRRILPLTLPLATAIYAMSMYSFLSVGLPSIAR